MLKKLARQTIRVEFKFASNFQKSYTNLEEKKTIVAIRLATNQTIPHMMYYEIWLRSARQRKNYTRANASSVWAREKRKQTINNATHIQLNTHRVTDAHKYIYTRIYILYIHAYCSSYNNIMHIHSNALTIRPRISCAAYERACVCASALATHA